MLNFIKKITGKASIPAWVGIVVAGLTILVTLLTGGTATENFTGKDGSEYQVVVVMPEGVLDLIEKCDLKKVGDTCPVAISVTATMTKEPTVAPVVAPPADVVVVPPKEVKGVKLPNIKLSEKDTAIVPLPDKVVVEDKVPVSAETVPEKKEEPK